MPGCFGIQTATVGQKVPDLASNWTSKNGDDHSDHNQDDEHDHAHTEHDIVNCNCRTLMMGTTKAIMQIATKTCNMLARVVGKREPSSLSLAPRLSKPFASH